VSELCKCGCGETAPIATKTDKGRGSIKGQPQRFIRGHWKKEPNQVRHLSDGTSVIVLERKDGTTLDCLIDTVDYDKVKNYRWAAHKSHRTVYAITNRTDGGPELMHRLLLPDCEEVDHWDHCGLRNVRSNLRAATGLQNRRNQQKHKNGLTSKFKGVSRHKRSRNYVAYIQFDGAKIYLGLFDSEEAAARVWDEAAKKYRGSFACLNFPETAAA
jgi:hypothetical protein